MIELLGVCAVVALVVAMWSRPAGMFAVLLALTVVGAAIVVSWNEVEHARQERLARQAFEQRNAGASAVTVPPANPPHAGS